MVLFTNSVWTELKHPLNQRITETNYTAEEPRFHKIWGQQRESLVSFDYPCLCSLDINEEPSMFLISTFLNYDVHEEHEETEISSLSNILVYVASILTRNSQCSSLVYFLIIMFLLLPSLCSLNINELT